MSEGKRFQIVERYADNGTHSHWALVDTTTGRELGCDGGEPEDQLLVRDWSWVADELNKLADLISRWTDEKPTTVDVGDWVRFAYPGEAERLGVIAVVHGGPFGYQLTTGQSIPGSTISEVRKSDQPIREPEA